MHFLNKSAPRWTKPTPDLWDDGELGAQIMETDTARVDVIDDYAALCRLDEPEETHRQGGFPRPCPTNDTGLMR